MAEQRRDISPLLQEDAAFLEDEDLLILARSIGSLPGQEPPPGLSTCIMRHIQPRRRSVPLRIWHWLRLPRTVTFTPMQLIPAAAAVLALLVMLPLIQSMSGNGEPSGHQVRTTPIRFTLSESQASSVALIGSFNQWDPNGFEMKPAPNGNGWVLEVELPSGRHEYAYLLDGQKVMADPKAVFTKNDGFGNRNSVILVNHDIAI